MRFNKAFLQATALVVMLAELPADAHLKSGEISTAMKVSHTYLQKIAKKLKDAGIIQAEASKNGGYALNRPIDQITFANLFEAIEGDQPFTGGYDITGIRNMFTSQELTNQAVQTTQDIMLAAEASLKATLATHTIAEIVPKDDQGYVLELDWRQILSKSKKKGS